jgi:uroporphyrin-III C-methyltransferase
LNKLASLTDSEMEEILLDNQLANEVDQPPSSPTPDQQLPNSRHEIALRPTKGKIYLVGSGPGHPSLLTVAARDILTNSATVVLSDKLVPASVLELIPKSVRVVIARKFPGNADGAQSELMDMGIEAALKGETVVRVRASFVPCVADLYYYYY